MNSFNHYALGSVGEWIWRHVVGLNVDQESPAFKHFVIHPRPGGGLTWVKGEYDSIRGRIASTWAVRDGLFTLDVSIPPDTAATVYLPAHGADEVTERGHPAGQSEGVELLRTEPGWVVLGVSSGDYAFALEYGPDLSDSD